MDDGYTTWRYEITEEMRNQGESWGDVKYCTLTDEQLDEPFDYSYGSVKGKPFTVWTRKRVYFPKEYDGYESCDSVSRIIDKEPTAHI